MGTRNRYFCSAEHIVHLTYRRARGIGCIYRVSGTSYHLLFCLFWPHQLASEKNVHKSANPIPFAIQSCVPPKEKRDETMECFSERTVAQKNACKLSAAPRDHTGPLIQRMLF